MRPARHVTAAQTNFFRGKGGGRPFPPGAAGAVPPAPQAPFPPGAAGAVPPGAAGAVPPGVSPGAAGAVSPRRRGGVCERPRQVQNVTCFLRRTLQYPSRVCASLQKCLEKQPTRAATARAAQQSALAAKRARRAPVSLRSALAPSSASRRASVRWARRSSRTSTRMGQRMWTRMWTTCGKATPGTTFLTRVSSVSRQSAMVNLLARSAARQLRPRRRRQQRAGQRSAPQR